MMADTIAVADVVLARKPRAHPRERRSAVRVTFFVARPPAVLKKASGNT